MTKGFNPDVRNLQWKESLEKSLGQKGKKDLTAKTQRLVQESLKPSKKRSLR